MKRDLKRLADSSYDLLVIGGGINGTSIAHLAAKRGLKTALIDKGDFASGTSSKSSKLMHGGLRYLENFQFSLVREALKERTFHVQHVPHLVKPLKFVVPVYKGDKRPLWMMHLGVWLYDVLAGKDRIGKHARLSKKEVLALEPNLASKGLVGGVVYYDAQMDDGRLCIENALMADDLGAEIANYVEVIEILKDQGKCIGVRARDTLKPDSAPFEIFAKKIICAAGPWTNELLKMDFPDALPRVRPTKGVHFVTSKIKVKNGLLIPTRSDKRIFFLLPWFGSTMIGTTDTDYFGSPDEVAADNDDIEYLIRETKRVFPKVALKPHDVKIHFAGLRPLVAKSGKESAVPREHFIFRTDSGMHVVVGGKYTTYRVIARDCLDHLEGRKGPGITTLYGAGDAQTTAYDIAQNYQIDEETAKALLRRYGRRYLNLLNLIEHDEKLREPIAPGSHCIKAEVVYARQVEMAQTDDDIIYRRLSVGYVPSEIQIVRHASFNF